MKRSLKTIWIPIAGATALLFLFQNCTPGASHESAETSSGLQASFQSVSGILANNCLGCHSANQASGGVVLDTYDDLISSGVVVPGNVDASSLYLAVASGRMPQVGSLSSAEIDMIRRWIAEGAPSEDGEVANQIPIVDAGFDRNLQLPVGVVTLIGGASDTDGTITQVYWSQATGPGTLTLQDADSNMVRVSGIQSGTYSLRFQVSDNENALAEDIVFLYVTDPDVSGAPTFTQVFSTVIQPKCLSCHSGNNPSGQYDMSTYEGLMTNVAALNASASPMYQEVVSGQMPRAPNPDLPQNEVDLIRDWINAGALNN